MLETQREKFDYVGSYTLGHSYNVKFAKRLQDSGINCYPSDLVLSKNSEETRYLTKYEKDVILTDINGCIEVKSSSTYWEDGDVSSIKSKYSSLFVDSIYGYEQKVVKPLAYVLISQKTDGVLVVPTTTQPLWRPLYDRFDSKRDTWDDYYVVDFEHLRTFDELVAHLRSQLPKQ